MVRRLIPDLLVCTALAAASGGLLLLDGQNAFWTSNVSLAWLLLPLWFGWRCGRSGPGALFGVAATWCCLAAYYVLPTVVFHHGNLDLVTRFGIRYFALGAISGPVLGAVGAWWRGHPTAVVPLAVAVLAIGERWAWRWRLGYDADPAVFTVEAVGGALLAAVMYAWVRRARQQTQMATLQRRR